MIHHLKTWPEYFKAVQSGYKTFEVRKNDRNYNVGDTLILEEWDPNLTQYRTQYTSNVVEAKVLYILSDPQFVKDGFVIMGIEVFE